jgi:hypothetical protein
MTADNTLSRSLHDLGLATWFGGSLMGAVGLNGAAADVEEPKQRLRVANAGWDRWTPVNLAGIAAHVAGGAVLLGAKLDEADEVPVEGGTGPSTDTPQDVAKAQRQLKVLQWVIPALTGAVLVLNARMGEQQRPAQVTSGLLGRLRPGRAA